MTSSRTPVPTPPRRREASRWNDRDSTLLRPALAYAVAAALAIVAAEAVSGRTEPPAASPPRPPAHAVARRAGPSGDDGFSSPPPPVPTYVPAPAPAAQATLAPAPADDPPEAQVEEEWRGIPADAWKPPPPPNPDPSLRPAVVDVWPSKGPETGGERVQLRGRNLDPAFVLFGRLPAKILAVDTEQTDVVLTLLTPRRTGPAQAWVVVTNRDGSNAVAPEKFEYYR